MSLGGCWPSIVPALPIASAFELSSGADIPKASGIGAASTMSIQSMGAKPNSAYARVLVTKLPFPAALHEDSVALRVLPSAAWLGQQDLNLRQPLDFVILLTAVPTNSGHHVVIRVLFKPIGSFGKFQRQSQLFRSSAPK